MEYSSSYTYVNTPEDSGLGESSNIQNEDDPSSLFTPTTTLITSRKRKFYDLKPKSFALKMAPSMDSTESSPWIDNPKILSSTLNDSILASVEKCTLDHFANNYYVERSEFDSTTNTSSFFKNMKEPSTPEKCSNKRYYNCISSPKISPMLKLGSPERNEILYSTIPISTKLSSGKRSSPAKKCLFSLRSCKDPVTFFCKDRNMRHVFEKIFLMLSNDTLYTCSKVSRRWKEEIMKDQTLKERLLLFIKHKIMNKENICESPLLNFSTNSICGQSKQSTPVESFEPVSKMFEMTNSIIEDHLEKCLSCNKPEAVVKGNISQCTNHRCGMIRCLKCNSISTTGPENFQDKCQESRLDYEKPSPRYPLLSSPKRYQNENGIPTLFLDDSLNTSQTLNSSGYITDSDMSQNSRRHSMSINKDKLDISQVLKTNNMNVLNKPERNFESRIKVLPVITSTRKIEELIEPSSPPKVKHVACSKKSKKMLKRLNL